MTYHELMELVSRAAMNYAIKTGQEPTHVVLGIRERICLRRQQVAGWSLQPWETIERLDGMEVIWTTNYSFVGTFTPFWIQKKSDGVDRKSQKDLTG